MASLGRAIAFALVVFALGFFAGCAFTGFNVGAGWFPAHI